MKTTALQGPPNQIGLMKNGLTDGALDGVVLAGSPGIGGPNKLALGGALFSSQICAIFIKGVGIIHTYATESGREPPPHVAFVCVDVGDIK